jgi:hypothetical protein
MADVDGAAGGITAWLIADRFYFLFAGVTAPRERIANSLKLAFPEQPLIAAVRDDVVGNRAGDISPLCLAHTAERFSL